MNKWTKELYKKKIKQIWTPSTQATLSRHRRARIQVNCSLEIDGHQGLLNKSRIQWNCYAMGPTTFRPHTRKEEGLNVLVAYVESVSLLHKRSSRSHAMLPGWGQWQAFKPCWEAPLLLTKSTGEMKNLSYENEFYLHKNKKSLSNQLRRT